MPGLAISSGAGVVDAEQAGLVEIADGQAAAWGDHENVPGNSLLDNALAPFTPYAPSKEEILADVPVLKAEPVPGVKPTPNVGSNHYWIGRVEAGTLAGLGGAETCTGVILVPVDPSSGKPVLIFHFGGQDDVAGTLGKLNLTGYKAYISGAAQGRERDAHDRNANSSVRYTLKAVVKGLRNQGVPIVGYYEVGDLAVDSNGTIFNTTVRNGQTKQFAVRKPPVPLPRRHKPPWDYIWAGPFIFDLNPEGGA